jgi:hypothetical protein
VDVEVDVYLCLRRYEELTMLSIGMSASSSDRY